MTGAENTYAVMRWSRSDDDGRPTWERIFSGTDEREARAVFTRERKGMRQGAVRLDRNGQLLEIESAPTRRERGAK